MASFHCEIKSGRKGSAAEHAAYVARDGWHGQRGDLVMSGHGNLPPWTGGDPAGLWKAADKYERVNGSAYREIVIALPSELSLDQLRLLVDHLVLKLAGQKAYQYAVHAPKSSLQGEVNLHLHLMISDRMQDDIERTAEQTFSRFNSTDPAKGGCRKDSGGRTRMQLRDELIAKRKLVAEIQNEHLATHGHQARVDHRTLNAQGIRRNAERHLGQGAVRIMTAEQRAYYVASRRRPLGNIS